ncbi:MAG TPA: septum site-determining protein MinC [Anaerolineaceae bacterium]|nr:septum site-determining protein MinC [Anaerolineaceae bacterium]HQC64160.1 septum site-determining protein MinC [Anaerolineaceae bacterium]
MSQRPELTIKGYRGGVLITLPAVSCFAQRDLLIRRIQSQERFFKGGRIALDVGETTWNEDQISRLLRDLSDEGVCLWAILSTSQVTLDSAANYDIPTSIKRDGEPKTQTETSPAQPDLPKTTWLEKDISADLPEQEHYFEGKLCLIGDVKPGASLSADESILIWGKASGQITAGEKPCPNNCIFVLFYDGAQFRLNGKEVTLPKNLKTGATLKIWRDDQTIKVEVLKEKRFGIL